MVDATLNKNMLCLLKKLKNSKFISYECAKNHGSAYGNLRINTDNGSIEITNIEKTMPFFDIEEDVTSFECEISDPCAEFKPYCIEPFESFEVGEIITGIEIINDEINVNDGEYEISFDQAIIIRTEKQTIMFSRDIWFSEVITIFDNDNYDAFFPVEQAIDAWSEDGENDVKVIRTKKVL